MTRSVFFLGGGEDLTIITIIRVAFLTIHLPLQSKNMFSFSVINFHFLCFMLSIVDVHYHTQKLELKQNQRIRLNLKIYLAT